MIEWYICFIECLWASHVTIYKVFTTVLAYRKCSVKAEFIIIFTVILCDPMNGFHQAPCPWDSPGMNTGMGCHSLLQGIFPDPQIKHASPGAPAMQADSFPDEPLQRGWLQRVLPTAFLWRLALSLTQMVDLWLPSAWTAPSQLTVNAWLMRATQAHPNPIDFKVQSGLQSCLQQRAGMPLGAFPSPIQLPHPPLPRAPPPAPNTWLRLCFLFSGPERAAPACHRHHQQRGGGRHGVAAWLTQVRGLNPLKSGSDWESAALEGFRLSFLSLQGVFGKKQVNKVTNQQKAWGPCSQWRQSRPLGWWHRIGQRCNRASWDVSHVVQANRSPSGQHSRGGWRGEASPQACSP